MPQNRENTAKTHLLSRRKSHHCDAHTPPEVIKSHPFCSHHPEAGTPVPLHLLQPQGILHRCRRTHGAWGSVSALYAVGWVNNTLRGTPGTCSTGDRHSFTADGRGWVNASHDSDRIILLLFPSAHRPRSGPPGTVRTPSPGSLPSRHRRVGIRPSSLVGDRPRPLSASGGLCRQHPGTKLTSSPTVRPHQCHFPGLA